MATDPLTTPDTDPSGDQPAGRRLPRLVRWPAGWLAGLAAHALSGLVIVLAIAFWRLAQGPVPLDPLVGEMEAALSGDGRRVTVGAALLDWRPGFGPPGLTARAVRLEDGDDRPVAEVSALLVRVDVPALLTGTLKPRELIATGLEIHVDRDAAGDIHLRASEIATGDTGASGAADTATLDLADLAALFQAEAAAPRAAPDPAGRLSLGDLDALQLFDGVVHVDDRRLGRTWQATSVAAEIRPGADGLAVTLSADAALAGGTVALDGALELSAADGRGAARLSLRGTGVDAQALADWHPALAPLAAVTARGDVHVSARAMVDLAGDPGGEPAVRPSWVGFDVSTGPTVIDTAGWLAAPLSLGAARLTGAADLLAGTLRIGRLDLDLGGPRIEATANLDAADATGAHPLRVDGRLDGLPVDFLGKLWPPALEPGGRDWVTANLSRGLLHDGQLSLTGRLWPDPTAGGEAVVVDSLDIRLGMADMQVVYLDGMPPITGLDGTATIDLEAVEIAVGGGTTAGLAIPEAAIRIDGFDLPDAWIDIDVAVAGSLRAVLALLDHPRLGYARRIGLDPAAAGGEAGVRLGFRFPLLAALLFEEVALAASATIADGSVGPVAAGLEVADIDGRLDLTGRGMTLTGQATANQVPLDFTWQESFASATEISRLEIDGRLDDDQRARLGLDVLPGVTGPVAVTATLVDHDRTRQSVEAVIDLTPAALALDALGYAKAEGEPSRLEIALALSDLQPVAAPRVVLEAPRLRAAGRLDFRADGTMARIDLGEIALDDHRLAALVSWLDDDSLSVELRGAFLDLEALIADRGRTAGGGTADGAAVEEAADDGAGESAAPAPPAPMAATLAFDRVRLREDGELVGVTGLVEFDGEGWQRIDLAGGTDQGGRVALTLAAAVDGRHLAAEVEGLGTVLADLDLTDGVDGGLFSADVTLFDDAEAGSDAPGSDTTVPAFSGSLQAERFRVREVPLLARLIAALSISGLQSLMQTDGLVFERAAVHLTSDGSTIRLENGRAFGGALGLRLEGEISVPADTIEAYGTIVPLYGVNGFLAGIPLIGDILTGSSGGIFAFTYAITGPLDAPSVSVNPLSVLAPGFLRDVFFLGDTDDEIAEGQPSESALPEFPDRDD